MNRRRWTNRHRLFAIVLCGLFALVACGGPRDVPDLSSLTPEPFPTAAPGATGLPSSGTSIKIVSPEDGDSVVPTKRTAPSGRKLDSFRVKVEVSGFKIVEDYGGKAVAGQGHVVYYVWNGYGDDGTAYQVPTALGQPANSGGNSYVAAAEAKTSYTWFPPFVRPGRQALAVQLVSSDHTPLDPPQVARINVEVSAPTGTPEPTEGAKEEDDDEGER
jgi:hypothetical protein